MAQFPIRETEILGLGSSLITGLTNNAALYPAPPVTPADLQIAFDLTIAARDAATAAEAAALQATTDKELAFQNLTDKMKEDLRYAENTVNMDDDKLKLLGWGGRKAPEALQPPGQARLLEAPREGESRKRGLYQASESSNETGLSPFLEADVWPRYPPALIDAEITAAINTPATSTSGSAATTPIIIRLVLSIRSHGSRLNPTPAPRLARSAVMPIHWKLTGVAPVKSQNATTNAVTNP